MLPKRKCPLCGFNEITLLYTLDFSNNEEINGLPNNYDIVICKNCSLVYDDFNSTQKEFDNYYMLNSTYNETTHITNDENNYGEYYKNTAIYIKNYLKQDSKILDVGCGSGYLLNRLYDIGFNNIYGIDETDSYNLNLKNNKVNFIKGNIFINDNALTSKFDLIICNHVLEHIFDLKSAMNNLNKLLSKNGLLYIAIPDTMQYINSYNGPFSKLGIEHINHFSTESIINMAKLYGYDIVDIGRKDTYVNLPEIFFILKKNNIDLLTISQSKIISLVKEYTAKSEYDIKNNLLYKFINSNEKLYIWGISTSSLPLFSLGLEKCNIVGIVDSSPKKQGKTLLGYKIISPNEIKDEDATILILPVLYKDSIIKQIKEMGFKNKIESIAEQSRAEQSMRNI